MPFFLRYLCFFSCVFLSTFIWAAVSQNKITGLQFSIDKHKNTQILLSVLNSTHYHVFMLKHPDRLVLDINNAVPDKTKGQFLPAPLGLIQSTRMGYPRQKVCRLVFDLKHSAYQHVYENWDPKTNKQLILIQLTQTAKTAVEQQVPANFVVKSVPYPVLRAHDKPKKSLIVILDPGHGGKDPGAIGINGIKEKDVVLAIAKKIAYALNQRSDLRVFLTRTDDRYLALRERLAIARKDKADFFIAVHADAFSNPSASGASVYALSLRGASSEAARWLAEKENYSELAGVSLNDKNDLLRSTLLDLSQAATIRYSVSMGNDVLQQLALLGPLHHDEIETAAFVVLKSPDIPSILVETGFLSHQQDARNLQSPLYQKKLAQAVAAGIVEYTQGTSKCNV